MQSANSSPQTTDKSGLSYILLTSLSALGIVFGDIGTSPLYAIRECFSGEHGLPLTPDNIFGILSLITWSLLVIISGKYVFFVMRADNRGEGGILALMALVQAKVRHRPFVLQSLISMGLFGAALLYGDGMITPAISVLSAVEGLAVAAPFFDSYIVPIAVCVLILIFVLQSKGTGKIGKIFGPIILTWFAALAALGIYHIGDSPEIIRAVNPAYAIDFMARNRFHGILALGAVFLVVTGGEALYADMGHFGKRAIRIGWYYVVLPALLLNYFGQGALLLADPSAIENPFFRLAPKWGIYPLIGLATAAAVIASQALISGAFSLTRQAIQLGYLPRTAIKHTSQEEIGQIYSPFINWTLLSATIFLVLFFKSSSSLASAYGIAVAFTMAITTVMMFFVTRYIWQWHLWASCLVTGLLLIADIAFVSANVVKVRDGGWFPLVIAGFILLIMSTWRRGRRILAQRLRDRFVPTEDFLTEVAAKNVPRVQGTAIFMTSNMDFTPPALIHNLVHNKILHSNILVVTVQTAEIPFVSEEDRTAVTRLQDGYWQIAIRYGFMETPDIMKVIGRILELDPALKVNQVSYFLGRETFIATSKPGMAIWREKLFAFLSRNAQRATVYFNIPPKDVIEIGIQIEL